MTTSEILAAFPQLSVLVVGDICLDRWCIYDPATAEPSRETGIPRIGVVSVEVTPGAGGTIGNNLAALGAGRIAVLGAVGEDGFGYELGRALRARGIQSDLLVATPEMRTFTYTKVINSTNGVEDMPRLDFINAQPMPTAVEREVVARLGASFASFDVILVGDQAETNAGGVVTPAVRDALTELAARHPSKTVLVDSRLRVDLFRNVAVKPNQQEAEAASQRLFGRIDYPALRRHAAAPFLYVTHGSKGVLVVDEQGESWVPTVPVEHPVDICGAGDSFHAGSALAYAVTGSAIAAARFGNLVASITIMKKGTGTASPEEVLRADQVVPR
jgi:rfaE bifunctional protein kinase chain/domain